MFTKLSALLLGSKRELNFKLDLELQIENFLKSCGTRELYNFPFFLKNNFGKSILTGAFF
jgi:hypothetical protein